MSSCYYSSSQQRHSPSWSVQSTHTDRVLESVYPKDRVQIMFPILVKINHFSNLCGVLGLLPGDHEPTYYCTMLCNFRDMISLSNLVHGT